MQKNLKQRFENAILKLKSLGFNGEVYLRGGVLMVLAKDKLSASMIRRAFKQVRSLGLLTEVKSNESTVFCHMEKASLTHDVKNEALHLMAA